MWYGLGMTKHTNCDHEATPKARAACRAKRALRDMSTPDLIAAYNRDRIPAAYTITAREAMRRRIAPQVAELLRRANDLDDPAAQAFFDETHEA